jgi:hypothetical protein
VAVIKSILKLIAREKVSGSYGKFEDFETHFGLIN